MRSFLLSILDSMESRRSPSCSRDISSEKMTTRPFFLIATFWAMLSAKAVFPMDGRAATMIRSDFCSPVVMRSRSEKPVDRPGMAPPLFSASWMLSMFLLSTSRSVTYWLLCLFPATS